MGKEEQEKMAESNDSAEFGWQTTNLKFTRTFPVQQSMPLSSDLLLRHIVDGEARQVRVSFSISMERELEFDQGMGWSWHKSWKIPSILVTIKFIDELNGKQLKLPVDILAEAFIVKRVMEKNMKFALQEVGHEGHNKALFENGVCLFSDLKFKQTSYNNQKNKFHILLLVSLPVHHYSTNMHLFSKISDPIFVDSRKNARESQLLRFRLKGSITNLFPPSALDRKYVKKIVKNGHDFEEDIDNSASGFLKYMSAPNIRHKIKHPIFISILFSKCVELLCPAEMTVPEAVQALQTRLQNQEGGVGLPRFLIHIKDRIFFKECKEELSIYEGDAMQLTDSIPAKYRAIEESLLRNEYCRTLGKKALSKGQKESQVRDRSRSSLSYVSSFLLKSQFERVGELKEKKKHILLNTGTKFMPLQQLDLYFKHRLI